MNHREVLGVSADASQADIKKAFRQAAKELHPDLSDSPEAAEAFARIKEAHDALLADTSEVPRESVTAQASAARATAATAQAAYAVSDPNELQLTHEEMRHLQDLDEKARAEKHPFFHRSKESAEVRKHRKKIKTNERRLRGLY
jgi:DnaJ-domain-containing protein 1